MKSENALYTKRFVLAKTGWLTKTATVTSAL